MYLGITEAHILSLGLICLISATLRTKKALSLLLSGMIISFVIFNGLSKAFKEENLLRTMDLKRSKLSQNDI